MPTGSGLKTAKTKESLKNIDIIFRDLRVKAQVTNLQKYPKQGFFRCYLIHGYLQSQNDIHEKRFLYYS